MWACRLKRVENVAGEGGSIERGSASDDILGKETEDGEHGETSVGEFDGEFLALDGFFEVLSEVSGSVVSVFVRELGFEDPDEEEDLEDAEGRDLEDGLEAERNVGELDLLAAAQVSVAKGSDESRNDVSEDGDHRDATVLLLDSAETVELLLGNAVGQAKGIPKSCRGLCAEGC